MPSRPVVYTLSLHDALPICSGRTAGARVGGSIFDRQGGAVEVQDVGRLAEVRILADADGEAWTNRDRLVQASPSASRSEEHTSELQSRFDLVCRLLLEKKKK